MIDSLLFIASAMFLAMISPGANALNVISASVEDGRWQGLAVTLGVACGSCLWALLSVSGLALVLSTHAYMLVIIKIIGGLYLLWLAYKAFASAASKQDQMTFHGMHQDKSSFFAYVIRGFVVNISNPKALFAWVAIIAVGLEPNAPLWGGVVIIAGAPLLAITVYSCYALVFSSRVMVTVYVRLRRYIQSAFGLFFGWAGISMLLSYKEL